MKKTATFISLALSALTTASAPANTAPVLAPIPVTHVYSPLGFDSNDNVEVILKGYLPNLCYRTPSARVQVSGQSIQIQAQAQAYHPSEHVVCAQIAVPFLEPAQVGVLDRGLYSIVVNHTESNSRTASMRIVGATSSVIDDNVYANVTSVERVPGTRSVFLKGVNPVNCYEIQGVKSISNGTDTYAVLPIMKKVAEQCDAQPTPFTFKWDVPTDLSATEKNPLLHVRVMDGKSLNVIFDENE